MQMNIKIKMDNAAFDPPYSRELVRILRRLADRIEVDPDCREFRLLDYNGQPVGEAKITGKQPK
jgi:hypothetical protein